MPPTKRGIAKPSSNWLALQKKLPVKSVTHDSPAGGSRKRRRIEHSAVSEDISDDFDAESSFPRGSTEPHASTSNTEELKNGESVAALRKMISGELQYSSIHQQPGKYLSLDCEMVGVGPDGKESSLARVSLVNYYGAVQMDEFVRQRERVVDYRTEFSGIRASDMVNAKPFVEIQKQVSELLEDRILVGHAVHNDLKVLFLSHPRQKTRDTQVYAAKHKLTRSRYPALRHLVLQELGVTIQGGEHSSVTDARATMAVYRLHRKEWEKGRSSGAPTGGSKRKRAKEVLDDEDDEDELSTTTATKRTKKEFPGGGRKGVSSGLSTVVKRRAVGGDSGGDWWKELGRGASKGSVRLNAG